MTFEERNKIPDAERIKQFCLNTARNLCDELSDIEIKDNQIYGTMKEAMSCIETLIRIAKMADEIKGSEVKENE